MWELWKLRTHIELVHSRPEPGRFKWRHDSVLSYIADHIKTNKPDEVTVYADLPEQSINGGTIPADIVTTGQIPDIVIINRAKKKITLFELAISFEENIETANKRKSLKYHDLSSNNSPKSNVKITLKKRNLQMYTVETDIEKAANSTIVNQVALKRAVHIYTQQKTT